MKDVLHEYMKKHEPAVPKAPVDEWSQIVTRTRQDTAMRQNRAWIYLSALTLSAAAFLAFIQFQPSGGNDARLEIEDVIYREKAELMDRGAYGDWLWLADSVDAGWRGLADPSLESAFIRSVSQPNTLHDIGIETKGFLARTDSTRRIAR